MKMKILLADDDETIRGIAKFVFEKAGYQIETVVNGSELMARLERGGIGVVVTDNDMSRSGEGLDVLRSLRAGVFYKHLPVIVHSGSDDSELRSAVEEAGGIFIPKTADSFKEILKVLEVVAMGADGIRELVSETAAFLEKIRGQNFKDHAIFKKALNKRPETWDVVCRYTRNVYSCPPQVVAWCRKVLARKG